MGHLDCLAAGHLVGLKVIVACDDRAPTRCGHKAAGALDCDNGESPMPVCALAIDQALSFNGVTHAIEDVRNKEVAPVVSRY